MEGVLLLRHRQDQDRPSLMKTVFRVFQVMLHLWEAPQVDLFDTTVLTVKKLCSRTPYIKAIGPDLCTPIENDPVYYSSFSLIARDLES